MPFSSSFGVCAGNIPRPPFCYSVYCISIAVLSKHIYLLVSELKCVLRRIFLNVANMLKCAFLFGGYWKAQGNRIVTMGITLIDPRISGVLSRRV